MEIKLVVAALAALAQESRLTIFRLLVQAGPQGLPAGKISEMTQIAPSSLSFHLKEMTHAEMVTSKQAGRFVIYSANFTTMNGLIAFLTENCCAGVPCTPEGMICSVGEAATTCPPQSVTTTVDSKNGSSL